MFERLYESKCAFLFDPVELFPLFIFLQPLVPIKWKILLNIKLSYNCNTLKTIEKDVFLSNVFEGSFNKQFTFTSRKQ